MNKEEFESCYNKHFDFVYRLSFTYVKNPADAEDVAQEDIGYLGLLGSVLGYVDTESYSYADLTNAINIYTGGISSTANLYPNMNRQKLGVKYEFRIKVLEEGLDKALELLEEIIMLR